MRKGRVYRYWKDGGRFRLDGGGGHFAFIDMLPRGGWDGRSVRENWRSAARE
jgi:hypothetical protein